MYSDRIGEDQNLKAGDLIKLILLCTMVSYILLTRFFLLTVVSGSSMEESLYNGEYYYSSIFTMHALGAKRSDIVVIKFKDNFLEDDEYVEKETYLVKRLIGIPGDRIDIIEGECYLNGEKLEEDYALKPKKDEVEYYLDGSWQLDEGEYFVMGDNRLPYASYDSRSFGPIMEEDLKSIVRFRLYGWNDLIGIMGLN